jgi:hypothetical protein
LSGKIFVAVVTAAVSSASAATVGVVYTKIVEPKHIEASASVSETASAGPVGSAVVLNASDSLFGFFAGSTGEGDSSADSAGESDPTCRGKAGCVMLARASDRRVNILGSAGPSFWLGGDSRDSYADRAMQDMLLAFNPAKVVVHVGRRRLKTGTLGFEPQSDGGLADSGTEDPSGSGPQNTSGTFESGNWSPTSSSPGLGYPIEIEFQTSPLLPFGTVTNTVDSVSWPADPLTAYSPIDTAPIPTPLIGFSPDQPPWQPPAPDINSVTTVTTPPVNFTTPSSPSPIPEPSTWVMMIAGLATLGLFKRRRFAAALKAMRG